LPIDKYAEQWYNGKTARHDRRRAAQQNQQKNRGARLYLDFLPLFFVPAAGNLAEAWSHCLAPLTIKVGFRPCGAPFGITYF